MDFIRFFENNVFLLNLIKVEKKEACGEQWLILEHEIWKSNQTCLNYKLNLDGALQTL